MHVLAAEWGTGQVFWSMLWFFMFFIWIWLLIIVFSDVFRSHDLSGVAEGPLGRSSSSSCRTSACSCT